MQLGQSPANHLSRLGSPSPSTSQPLTGHTSSGKSQAKLPTKTSWSFALPLTRSLAANAAISPAKTRHNWGMGKKRDAAEIDRRVHTVVRLLSSAKTNSYILRFCAEEWGVRKRQAETYLQRAREIIKKDYSVERSDFLGTLLALLNEIIEASIRSKQHSNAVGALKLQAQLKRLIEGS